MSGENHESILCKCSMQSVNIEFKLHCYSQTLQSEPGNAIITLDEDSNNQTLQLVNVTISEQCNQRSITFFE